MNIAKGFPESDRPLIAALYWEAFGSKLGFVMGPKQRAMGYFCTAVSPDHAICARDTDGTLLGVAGFKTHEGALIGGSFRDMTDAYGWIGALWRLGLLTALERDKEEARFLMDGIFVAPHARGRGIGTQLLEAIAAEAAVQGYTEVRLDVIDSNARARALHERQGFVALRQRSIGVLRHVFRFRTATTMVLRVV